MAFAAAHTVASKKHVRRNNSHCPTKPAMPALDIIFRVPISAKTSEVWCQMAITVSWANTAWQMLSRNDHDCILVRVEHILNKQLQACSCADNCPMSWGLHDHNCIPGDPMVLYCFYWER